ncbi:Uncharacterized protein dnm_078020 [Desulfonema magnum]|uniref:Uncharacterized protein n=1 Tax=Desulfonema magnum TaxID=45655 RepID=A0A975BUW7_9BACT|nr:Uncharacterized protein dnm_078020 [Desulfonema magnum]
MISPKKIFYKYVHVWNVCQGKSESAGKPGEQGCYSEKRSVRASISTLNPILSLALISAL